jgi:hypothetical protein
VKLTKADRRHIREARRNYTEIISTYEAEKKAKARTATHTTDHERAQAIIKGA